MRMAKGCTLVLSLPLVATPYPWGGLSAYQAVTHDTFAAMVWELLTSM